MGLLDPLLRKVLQIAGVSLPERMRWNIVSGATAVDNESTKTTDITITGGAGLTLAGSAGDLQTNNTTNLGALAVPSGGLAGIDYVDAGDANSVSLSEAYTDSAAAGAYASAVATAATYTDGAVNPAVVPMSTDDIDWNAGDIQTKTLAAGANTFTMSNVGTKRHVVSVRVTGAASTLAWNPGAGPAILFPGGTAPTQTASGDDVYTLMFDGTSVYVMGGAQAFA